MIEVIEDKSDDEIPNWISGWALYELKFTKEVPAFIIAAPPSDENSDEVTGLSPFEKTLFIFPIVVLSSKLILVISSNVAVPVLDELELINVEAPAANS